jgi:citrate lyase subunit beta / citryl-CoA lyase
MRSLLFAPADSERKLAKALAGTADVVILDLEDSVAPERKEAARRLAAECLAGRREGGPQLFVRLNPQVSGLLAADLAAVMPAGPDGLMLPKTGGGEDVLHLARHIDRLVPVIAIATETAAAMFALGSYAPAVPPLIGLAWGAEDLSSDLGALASRDVDGRLTDPYRLARTLCLLGARAAGVEPIDTVCLDFRDSAGLARECQAAMRDGFSAKLAIHPDQVDIINEVFTPSTAAIAEAQAVIDAFAAAEGAGVVAIAGRMYDIPHRRRAEKLLARANVRQSADRH